MSIIINSFVYIGKTDKHEFITFPFGEIFILYKKIIQGDKYLVIIAISPHEK